MIKRIATVTIYVEDQDQALRFWTEQVGFTVHADHPMGPSGRWIEVGPAGAETKLVLYPRALMTHWTELKPSLVFLCDDIESTYQRMKENGVVFQGEPNKMPYGTFAVFKDLDGYEYVLKG
jgi:lactoylglutathione lyase